MISLATFWGRSSCGKKRCFLYRLFFIYPIFYSFIIHIVQQTADLFRLVIDCSRDFVGGFHPTSYDTTISSAVLFLPTVYSYGCSLSRIDSSCLRDLSRIDSSCLRDLSRISILINLSTCMFTIPYHPPSILTLCSVASLHRLLRRSIPTA